MNLLEYIHSKWIYGRRVRVLAEHFARLLPENAKVLDVGCGDGLIARRIAEQRKDLQFTGAEVYIRPTIQIPTVEFDGNSLPFPDHRFDVAMLVDVLHHAIDPTVLLREACRVSRGKVLIKDHLLEGVLAGPILKLMDRTGNGRHGVPIPFNFWQRRQWKDTFVAQRLHIDAWMEQLGLYPKVLGWPFERNLHFITLLSAP